jgi:L-2-hydroxyglutarate oxidase LhgO
VGCLPGLYYPVDSLKTRMCVRGRDLMYEYCAAKNVAHKQVTKLVVGPASAQGYLQKMVAHVDALPAAHRPQIRLVSGAEAREMEPDLSPDVGCAVHSLSTGIVSSHELMASFERDILEAECAEIVYGTRVLRIDPVVPAAGGSSKRGASADESGWIVQTQTGDSEHVDMLKARVVINAAGLNAPSLLNGLLRDGHFGSAPADWAAAGSGEGADEQRPLAAYYMKGNYATYKGEGARNVSRLIYPVPSGMAGSNDAHKHTSLGSESQRPISPCPQH